MSEEKRVLVICNKSEVPLVEEGARHLEEEYYVEIETIEKIFSIGVQKYLLEMIELIQKNPSRYDGIIGTRDVTSVFVNVICEKTGKISTSVESMINSQNKYISRLIQRKAVPESTPDFWLDSEFLREFPLSPPFFVKPVRGNVSYLSQKIYSYDSLRNIITENMAELAHYNQYFLESLAVASHLSNQLNLETCNKFLCEKILSGPQLTVNGYVFKGEVKLYGSAKAVFMEDGLSFSHHEFPYEAPQELDKKINEVTSRLVEAIGLDNTFFNVEVRLDLEEEKVYIIEINSRPAFQFVKTVEVVNGINLIRGMCDIAVGKEPAEEVLKKGEKRYNYCFNFELREPEDREIIRVPMKTDLEEIERNYPGVTVKNLVDANTNLSDYKQNPKSYRYCLIDIPGDSREEIEEKLEEIKPLLGYEFKE